MSWLKSAVNRAVEVSGRSPLGRTVKNYAGTVAHHAGQAVAARATLLHNRNNFGTRNYKNFTYTAKKLEEVVVSCRGNERVELLRQLLVLMKGKEGTSGNPEDAKTLEQTLYSELSSPTPKKAPLVLFPDSDFEGDSDSVNFRDVFLHSQALEGLTLSMIMEAPNEEEVSLLLEIFGLCLTGDKEVHNAIMSSIKQLAKTFSSYHDEVLVKREELLQFAQSAISGVKLNTDISRIDAEASDLWKTIDELEAFCISSHESSKQPSVEDMKAALEEVELCSKLEELLLKKGSIKPGDSAKTHSEKVDKLKVLAESLANSSSKAEMRISDHRNQLEEALNFRVAKANEVSETEKGLAAEIAGLEKQRDKLEAELMKVNMSLKSARVRLNKHREERNHFDEASNQIILHLKSKENELSRSIVSFKVEADTVNAWIKFLEETWAVQSSYAEIKEKQTNEELQKYGNCFLKLIRHHLLACKEELRPTVNHMKTLVDSLKSLNIRPESMPNAEDEVSSNSKSQKTLEEEYLKAEEKVVTAFSVVDHMRELFYTAQAHSSRRDDPEIKDLFDDIEKIRGEVVSIERPRLDLETPKEKPNPSDERLAKSSSRGRHALVDEAKIGSTESPMYPETTLSEYGDASGDWTNEEILGWEFD